MASEKVKSTRCFSYFGQKLFVDIGDGKLKKTMNDFEIWWEKEGLKRFKGYSDTELVAMCGICKMAWNAALKETASDFDRAGELKTASPVRRRVV